MIVPFLRRAVVAALSLMLAVLPARAEQASIALPTTGPHSMSDMMTNYINPALRTVLSCSSGTTPPANGPNGAPMFGQCWIDTSNAPVALRYYDGGQWLAFAKFDPSNHAVSLADAILIPSTQVTGLGTAATVNIGAAGGTLCPLNASCAATGNNTHAGAETFTGPVAAQNNAPGVPGFYQFNTPDGVRRGIIGHWDGGTNLVFLGENGWGIKIYSPQLIAPSTPALTGYLYGNDAAGVTASTTIPTTALSGTLRAAQFPALTGDISCPAGQLGCTLATVNAAPGTIGGASAVPVITVNGKGLTTTITTVPVVAPAGTLTGTTLASGIVNSSLATFAAGAALGNLAANSVGYDKVTQAPAVTFSGNPTGATANRKDMNATEATAGLNPFGGDSGSGGAKGLVPAPQPGDAAAGKVLGAGGSFIIPPTGNAFPNGLTAQSGAAQYQMTGRTSPGFPVPYFTPVANNQVIAWDIFPKGAPANINGINGVVWSDLCWTDVSATNDNECLETSFVKPDGTYRGYAAIGTTAYNNGVVRPFVLQPKGGLIEINGDGAAWPAMKAVGANLQVRLGDDSAYAGIAGGVVYADTFFRSPLVTPASSTAACTAGTARWDASYIYICTAANTYKRVALAAF